MSDIEFNIEGFQERFKRDHPIEYWFDQTLSWIQLGYAPHYSVTHPHILFMDLFREVKWAWQRIWIGWDERVSWSIDFWLNPIMIKEIAKLKNTSAIPSVFFKNQESDDNDDYLNAQLLWHLELDKMVLGFESARKLVDLDYDYKNKELEEKLKNNFDIGMNSFKEHYFSLWD